MNVIVGQSHLNVMIGCLRTDDGVVVVHPDLYVNYQ